MQDQFVTLSGHDQAGLWIQVWKYAADGSLTFEKDITVAPSPLAITVEHRPEGGWLDGA